MKAPNPLDFPVSSAVDQATQQLIRAKSAPDTESLLSKVKATLSLVVETLNDTHSLSVEDMRGPDGKVEGVALLGRMPAVQLQYSPSISTTNAIFHTFPLTDAVMVAALVSMLSDALASIPGNPVQIIVGPPMAVQYTETEGGGTLVAFTTERAKVLDEMVAVADELPQLMRDIRGRVLAATAANDVDQTSPS